MSFLGFVVMALSACATTMDKRAPASVDESLEANSVKIVHYESTNDIAQTYWVYGVNFERGNIVFLSKTEKDSCTSPDALRVLVSTSSNTQDEDSRIFSYILNAYAKSKPIKAELVRFDPTHYNKDAIIENNIVRLAAIPDSELNKDIKLVNLTSTLGGARTKGQLRPGRFSNGHCIDRDPVQYGQ